MKANFASVEGNGKSPTPVQADQAFSIRLKSWNKQDNCIVAQVFKKNRLYVPDASLRAI